MGASNKHARGNYKQTRAANLLLSLAHPKQTNKPKRRKTKIPGVFECKTCDRQFPSFQALGGHMTSHLRSKVRFDGLSLAIGSTKFKGPKRHVCNLCGKEFRLGQALGGHKRLHRHPALVTEQLSNDPREAGIDLNMPPLHMNTFIFA
jgi:C2H2-type zinc finger